MHVDTFEEPLAKLTKALRIKTDCISWEIFRMLRTFILCVIGRLIFMGQGIRSSIWMIRSMVLITQGCIILWMNFHFQEESGEF